MKVGDLVKFKTTVLSKSSDRVNPGLALSVKMVPQYPHRLVALVLWGDGTTTEEHDTYLEVISESR